MTIPSRAPKPPSRPYYEDPETDGWDADDWHALWRRLNKVFLNRRGTASDELDQIDLSRVDARVRYLMKHLLVLQGRFEQRLEEHPGLRALQLAPDELPPDWDELVLSRAPRDFYPYLQEKGIRL